MKLARFPIPKSKMYPPIEAWRECGAEVKQDVNGQEFFHVDIESSAYLEMRKNFPPRLPSPASLPDLTVEEMREMVKKGIDSKGTEDCSC